MVLHIFKYAVSANLCCATLGRADDIQNMLNINRKYPDLRRNILETKRGLAWRTLLTYLMFAENPIAFFCKIDGEPHKV